MGALRGRLQDNCILRLAGGRLVFVVLGYAYLEIATSLHAHHCFSYVFGRTPKD